MAVLPRLLRQFERNRRFWRRVRAGDPGECWPWDGEVDADGYGRFRGRRADELAYELARGGSASGTGVEHGCGNRLCVNPHHLTPR
jgi:hypothetical protein